MDDTGTNALLISTLFEVKQAIGTNAASNVAILLKLDSIERQTILTNGRISSLERWRSYLLGGFTVLSAAVIFIGWLVEVALRAHAG